MPRALAIRAFAALLALVSGPALALGIGAADNQTRLGQPLRFAVELLLDAGETLERECIAVDAWAGEHRLATSTLRWAIVSGTDPSRASLRLASSVAIDEPVVEVALHFSCPTRLARKFVALVDPPAVALAQAAPPVDELPPQVEPASALALKAAAQSAPPAARDAGKSAASAKATKRGAGASAPRLGANTSAPLRGGNTIAAQRGGNTVAPLRSAEGSTKLARAGKPSRPAAAPRAAPRLVVDAAEHAPTRERLAEPAVTQDAPQAPAAAASPIAEAEAAAASARERIDSLEAGLARLQAEGKATQASVALLQHSLQEAQAERYANPLVYGLGALAALLAAALAVALWKRPAAAHSAESPWYAEPAKAEADEWAAPEPTYPPPQSEAEPIAQTTASPMLISQAVASEEATSGGRGAARDATLEIEELIDVEQQAEFFVVLGQDEAAIDLLMAHLRSSGGASPLPYLKLLEIYRRRGDLEAAERIRERFNRRFNAYAPDARADSPQGRSLEEYPTVIASLQTLWTAPGQALRALEASLLRRDAAATTFDLPAYRELLLLYAVARDLAEREARAADVDLLLPLGEEPAPSGLTPLLPSAALRIDPPAEVDVDITNPEDPGAPSSRLMTDFGPTSGRMPLGVEPAPTRH